MKELRQLTQELREKLAAFLESEEAVKFMKQVKEAGDSGAFTGLVISTEHEDRQGEIVLQAGMSTELYMKNPVVLNSHNYYGIENIIGVTTNIYPGEVGGVKATMADGIWAPTEAGQIARKLWDAGMANAASIGFIAEEFDKVRPNLITRSQLLEYSIVPVPANGYATRLRAVGLTAEAVRAKGFEIVTEGLEPEEKQEPAAETPPAPAEENQPPVEPPAQEPAPPEEKKQLDKKDAQQIGIILAELSNVVADAIVRASQQILSIVQSDYGKSETGKAEIAEVVKANTELLTNVTKQIADLSEKLGISEGEATAGEPAPEQRSEGAEAADMKDLNEFLMARQLLRSVATATNEALERLNKKAIKRVVK